MSPIRAARCPVKVMTYDWQVAYTGEVVNWTSHTHASVKNDETQETVEVPRHSLMPNFTIYPYQEGYCQICQEPPGTELSQFATPNSLVQEDIVAHAECGLDRGLELA